MRPGLSTLQTLSGSSLPSDSRANAKHFRSVHFDWDREKSLDLCALSLQSYLLATFRSNILMQMPFKEMVFCPLAARRMSVRTEGNSDARHWMTGSGWSSRSFSLASTGVLGARTASSLHSSVHRIFVPGSYAGIVAQGSSQESSRHTKPWKMDPDSVLKQAQYAKAT